MVNFYNYYNTKNLSFKPLTPIPFPYLPPLSVPGSQQVAKLHNKNFQIAQVTSIFTIESSPFVLIFMVKAFTLAGNN